MTCYISLYLFDMLCQTVVVEGDMLHQPIVVEGAVRSNTHVLMSHPSSPRAETHANGGSQRVTRLEGV